MIGSDYVLEAHNIYHTAEVGAVSCTCITHGKNAYGGNERMFGQQTIVCRLSPRRPPSCIQPIYPCDMVYCGSCNRWPMTSGQYEEWLEHNKNRRPCPNVQIWFDVFGIAYVPQLTTILARTHNWIKLHALHSLFLFSRIIATIIATIIVWLLTPRRWVLLLGPCYMRNGAISSPNNVLLVFLAEFRYYGLWMRLNYEFQRLRRKKKPALFNVYGPNYVKRRGARIRI